MRCIKCGKHHNGEYGTGKFCSASCAHSRIRTEEVKQKISESMIRAKQEGRWRPNHFSSEKIKEIIKTRKENDLIKLMEADFSTLKFGRLKKRVSIEQNNKCNRCGLDTWLNEPLILELEHKDGNTKNNSRENIECLCPNCHSLTDTWRGRNKQKSENRYKPKLKDEQILEAYAGCETIRQCLIKLELAPKGANYGRVKRVLTMYNIKFD